MAEYFEIPNPCSKRWSELQGEGRARFCGTCQTPVYSIDDYSRAECGELMRASGGHICGMLAGESAPEPRSRRAILVGALLTALSPLMAQTGRVKMVVKDQTDAVIPRAEVSLLGKDDQVIRRITADDRGAASWNNLPMGDLRFLFEAPGFKRKTVTSTVKDDKEIRLEVNLQVASMGEAVVIQK